MKTSEKISSLIEKHTDRKFPAFHAAEERNILCIDGGGMRGILPLTVLKRLRKRLDDLGYQCDISKGFDLLCGTSTGGLIVLALACCKEDLDMLEETYITCGQEIFPVSVDNFFGLRQITDSKYTADGIEKVLNSWFGDTTLADARVPVSVISYELLTGWEAIISSYATPSWKAMEAGRATSAAPTYFPPFRKDGRLYADGGVIANNPSVFAYTEARRLYPECRRFNVLSIGTAGKRHRMQPDAGSGFVDWVDQVLPMYQSSQKRASDFIMDALPDVRYVRIDGYLKENIKMDDTSEKSQCKLRELGTKISDIYDDELKWFASKIANAADRTV